MSDLFIHLEEIAIGGAREQFRVKKASLRRIAMAQHGVFTKKQYSDACLYSYPRFTKGPGGRWGIFESQLAEYWSRLRAKASNVVEIANRRNG